jgi:anti-sigma regulatory factor (Ser/Thr protein kinase)
VVSRPGQERLAVREVVRAIAGLGLSQAQLRRLETAVAEATLNAMEHGNQLQPERPVLVRVEVSETELCVSITDQGSGPSSPPEAPDLERKLAGRQSPRGWGLFLIGQMVDRVTDEVQHGAHTVHLSVRL